MDPQIKNLTGAQSRAAEVTAAEALLSKEHMSQLLQKLKFLPVLNKVQVTPLIMFSCFDLIS